MENVLKISNPAAKFINGAVEISEKVIFHVIHSKTLCMILGQPGESLPISVLFSCIDKAAKNECVLHQKNNPSISLVRILLSPHPYISGSKLCVGFQQANNIIIFYKQPMILTDVFAPGPVKLNTTIMINSSLQLDGAKPLSDFTDYDLIFFENVKKVKIDESHNQFKEFDPEEALILHNRKIVSICKPIMKKRSPPYPVNPDKARLHAQVFYAACHMPSIGKSPIGPFNSIMIMFRSHNTLRIIPNISINDIQRLFIKHVLLYRMGLENCVEDFVQVFQQLEDVTETQYDFFEHVIESSKSQVEDIVFSLNCISKHKFQARVVLKKDCSAIKLALEKYFLMFPAVDKENAINFSSSIIDIICRGISFERLVRFLEKYLTIQEVARETNLIKIFALLSI
ncbi:unknown [Suid gammaherpesvirus 3]|uniref:Tegument protein UL88 n=1 Tax=Suid gammaherpesvirus 3 TaxID=1960249 RepID=Q8JJR1_9GAMA|nr:unknown [Porcine lymphotropic herpesvirus 1]AAM22123.1 unknown [Porcine lymphotropic herpesvirus 1]